MRKQVLYNKENVMRYPMMICVLMVLTVGCRQQNQQPPRVQPGERAVNASKTESDAVTTQPQPATQVTAEVQQDTYKEYIARYTDQARTVKHGEPFMLDDDTPLTVGGQPVLFQGTDEYDNIVYQYDNVAEFRGRKVSHPIILPATVNLVANTPRPPGVLVGDAHIREYVLRVVSATHDECRYVATKKGGDH